MKLLTIVLALQVLLGVTLIALVATDSVPFADGDDADDARPARPAVDRFDSAAAWRLLRDQVELGPRPAGSQAHAGWPRPCAACCPTGAFRRFQEACAT